MGILLPSFCKCVDGCNVVNLILKHSGYCHPLDGGKLYNVNLNLTNSLVQSSQIQKLKKSHWHFLAVLVKWEGKALKTWILNGQADHRG